MDNNVLNDADKLREELQDGSFGEESTETCDNAADESVVADFLSQFGATGDTPLKAHDWKAYIPSSILDNADFWGPLFGIFRRETESFYVFDSKRYEDDRYLIGYVDNGSYLSSNCKNDFIYRTNCRLIGINEDGKIAFTYKTETSIGKSGFDPIAAEMRAQLLDGNDTMVDQEGTVLNPSDSTTATTSDNVFRPVSKAVVAVSGNNETNISFPVRIAHADVMTRISGSVTVSFYPKEGDTVTAERGGNRKPIKLLKAGPSGGEGTIYSTDIPNVVAKIYKPGKVDRAKFEKLKLMMTKNINCEGVCFPIAMLYNSNDEFVGYLMNKAQGKELQKCLFIPQLLKKYFPNWKKKDTVQLCITILKKIKYLHDRNIILGDINPNNILVVSSNEVYFVDTDSYQIEGYPCPVGTINYTAPEIQRKKFDTFLRTIGNEQFAVATLLFMIMLPGKPPYSLQGGENQIDNIINGDFAYASGERTNGKAPEGVWRYIWSHLPRYLKDDFYETFRKGGIQSTESTRFSDDDWIRKFEHYAELLSDPNGKFLTNDSMSADLFPNRLKKDANTTYVKCRLCGRDVDEERTEQGFCRDCLRSGETYRCSRCGDDIVYTNYQKYIRHSRRYDTCKACNDMLNSIYRRYPCANPSCRNMVEITYRFKESLECKGKRLPSVCKDCRDAVYTTIRCSFCNRSFDITFGEKEYFDNKGFDLPKKCPSCRSGKAPVYREQSYTSPRTYSSPATTATPKKKSSLCFITTAVCKYFNKPDDCYELTTLRKFRDTWLIGQPDGKKLIEEYYAIAPEIVNAIDRSSEKDKIYMHIWSNYIEPCIKLIELSANDTCKKLYVEMVNELKAKFC